MKFLIFIFLFLNSSLLVSQSTRKTDLTANIGWFFSEDQFNGPEFRFRMDHSMKNDFQIGLEFFFRSATFITFSDMPPDLVSNLTYQAIDSRFQNGIQLDKEPGDFHSAGLFIPFSYTFMSHRRFNIQPSVGIGLEYIHLMMPHTAEAIEVPSTQEVKYIFYYYIVNKIFLPSFDFQLKTSYSFNKFKLDFGINYLVSNSKMHTQSLNMGLMFPIF